MPQFAQVAAVKSPTLIVCLAASAFLLLLASFRWTLIDWITPFFMLPVEGAAWLFFAVSLALALVAAFRGRRRPSRAYAPLGICALAFVLLTTVPFTRIWLAVNFQLKLSAREAVVRQVASGELQPNVPHNSSLIALPAGQTLSAGGNEVVVYQTAHGPSVFFFTFRGILDNASGFLWVPPGASHRDAQELSREKLEVTLYAPSWYFVSIAP